MKNRCSLLQRQSISSKLSDGTYAGFSLGANPTPALEINTLERFFIKILIWKNALAYYNARMSVVN
jgi:hypothetical protein